MNEIPDELKGFFNSLENLESLNIWNIQDELKPTGKIDESWKEKLKTERKVLIYNLDSGQLVLNAQITDIKGKNLKLGLNKNEIGYIIDRLDVTNNTWLKSRYAHILWQELKHNTYAEIAIENYLRCIERIKADEVGELSIIVSAIHFISGKSKQKIEQVREISLQLLNELPNWLKASILTSILDNRIFSSGQLREIAGSIQSWISFDNSGSYFQNKNILTVGIRLYNKLKLSLDNLYQLLAKNEDLIIAEHNDDKDFIKLTSNGEKAKYFKLAGLTEESELVLKEFNRLKETVNLKEVSVQLGEKETEMLNSYLDTFSKIIMDMPTDSILAFFALNEDILVDPLENESVVKERINKSIHNLFTMSVFDINSNFKTYSDSDKFDRELIQNYAIAYGLKFEGLFYKVFFEAIISGKINYYKIHKFLEKHTWYGSKFKRGMTDRELDRNSSWITMLSPGIQSFMAQFELSVLMNTNKVNNFILATDSLTIKFEGALREFIKLSGGNTTTTDRSGDLREQLLEELLDNSTVKEYFTIRDVELFKYTFTKKGRNLRNEVAHSFLQYSDYSLQTITLVFFCILRLGKYTFEEKVTKGKDVK